MPLRQLVIKIVDEIYQHKFIYAGTAVTFSAKLVTYLNQITAVAELVSTLIAIVVGILTAIRIVYLTWFKRNN